MLIFAELMIWSITAGAGAPGLLETQTRTRENSRLPAAWGVGEPEGTAAMAAVSVAPGLEKLNRWMYPSTWAPTVPGPCAVVGPGVMPGAAVIAW